LILCVFAYVPASCTCVAIELGEFALGYLLVCAVLVASPRRPCMYCRPCMPSRLRHVPIVNIYPGDHVPTPHPVPTTGSLACRQLYTVYTNGAVSRSPVMLLASFLSCSSNPPLSHVGSLSCLSVLMSAFGAMCLAAPADDCGRCVPIQSQVEHRHSMRESRSPAFAQYSSRLGAPCAAARPSDSPSATDRGGSFVDVTCVTANGLRR
jgi:hypothetical protein